MLSRIQSRSTLLLPLVTLLSLPHLKRAHGTAVVNFGAIPTQTGIRLRWMRGFMPVSTIATPSSKAFAWDTKSQNKSATSSSFCCQEGQNPSFLTIETLWSSLEGFGRLESTWLDQGDYLKMWWGRRRWRARAGATIGHHRRSEKPQRNREIDSYLAYPCLLQFVSSQRRAREVVLKLHSILIGASHKL